MYPLRLGCHDVLPYYFVVDLVTIKLFVLYIWVARAFVYLHIYEHLKHNGGRFDGV